MSEMREALNQQRHALQALTQSRSTSAAWADDQRRNLDRECLDVLEADARKMLDALGRASQEILAAQRAVRG